jgi:hypothetical protein
LHVSLRQFFVELLLYFLESLYTFLLFYKCVLGHKINLVTCYTVHILTNIDFINLHLISQIV